MAEDIVGRDLYLRYTPVAGKPHIELHRVWDAARFIDSQIKAFGPDPKKQPNEIKVVSAATREEYLAARQAARA